jgi:3',5'-cyclic AMP phosphodiesterase CpdA
MESGPVDERGTNTSGHDRGSSTAGRAGSLFAASDLHIGYPENRRLVAAMRPESAADWLVVAGDVAEMFDDVRWALTVLSGRFEKVVWTPGNHELWTVPADPVQLRGEARYQELVRLCRDLGVVTPEDEYPVWTGAGGPVRIAPLFLLYDYSFRRPGVASKEESLRLAHEAGVVCTDEMVLHPDPYPSREAWCWARVEQTERRLAACDPAVPLVLVNHYPLVRQPTDVLWYPDFAQWCGTDRTADWHTRFQVAAVLYGHLHIPRTTWYDGVRFEEVSLGYPREWQRRATAPTVLRPVVLPDAAAR